MEEHEHVPEPFPGAPRRHDRGVRRCHPGLPDIMFAIFEYGRYLMVRSLVDNAAREGARAAIISPATLTPEAATAKVEARVQETMAGQQLTGYQFTIFKADTAGNDLGLWTDAPFGQNIVVEVSGNYTPMFPTFGMLPNPVRVRGRSMMRGEAN
jgi:Flp pilus assembly protein TadG